MSTTTIATRERPILFNTEMVRAILDGRKTQTRRVVDPRLYIELTRSEDPGSEPMRAVYQSDDDFGAMAMRYARCPYGRPGDRLWVREAWRCAGQHASDGYPVHFRADVQYTTEEAVHRWRPSIHMPRWASRIALEITEVRVQRLQEILSRDAAAEGWPRQTLEDSYAPETIAAIEALPEERRQMAWRMAPMREDRPPTPKEWFRALWDSINAARGYGWDANPWVWALTFRRCEP